MSEVEALVAERWEHLLREAYLFARGERLAQLHGRHLPRYDSRGLHTYSVIWGEILGCELLVPELATVAQLGDYPCTPTTMLKAARAEATRIFIKEFVEQSTEEAGSERMEEGRR